MLISDTRPASRSITIAPVVLSFAGPIILFAVGIIVCTAVVHDATALVTWSPVSLFPFAQLVAVPVIVIASTFTVLALLRVRPRWIWAPSIALSINLVVLVAFFLPVSIQVLA